MPRWTYMGRSRVIESVRLHDRRHDHNSTHDIVHDIARETLQPIIVLIHGSMDRQAGQRLSRFKTSGIRRTILILLAFSYLFVGVAHFFSCTDQAAAAASGATAFSDIARTFSDFPDEEGGKKTTQTAGHCHVCAPALIPADVQDVRHASRSAKLEVVSPELQFENHQRLDTPPPKHLT